VEDLKQPDSPVNEVWGSRIAGVMGHLGSDNSGKHQRRRIIESDAAV